MAGTDGASQAAVGTVHLLLTIARIKGAAGRGGAAA